VAVGNVRFRSSENVRFARKIGRGGCEKTGKRFEEGNVIRRERESAKCEIETEYCESEIIGERRRMTRNEKGRKEGRVIEKKRK
jgi:hypothetical protein